MAAPDLIAEAKKAREHASAPFSKFKVGAALRTRGGKVFHGCNVENSTYGLTVCAERVALLSAIAQGERKFDAIAVVTQSGAMLLQLNRLTSVRGIGLSYQVSFGNEATPGVAVEISACEIADARVDAGRRRRARPCGGR